MNAILSTIINNFAWLGKWDVFLTRIVSVAFAVVLIVSAARSLQRDDPEEVVASLFTLALLVLFISFCGYLVYLVLGKLYLVFMGVEGFTALLGLFL